MNRTNIVLLVLFLISFGTWLSTREGNADQTTPRAARLFPDFNKEAVDAIVIDGGWKGTQYVLERTPDGWVLSSGGDFPVKQESANEFIEAVASIRCDNLIGTSDSLKKTSRTDDRGRKVTIYTQGEKVAEFVVGKHPQGDWQAFFLRRADQEEIYRTKTISDEDAERESSAEPGPFGGPQGPRGFDWAQYTDDLFKWAKSQIWNLDDGEVQELWLERPGDGFSAKLNRVEEGKWSVTGKDAAQTADKASADTAAVEAITSGLSYLAFEDVVGAHQDAEAREKYGFNDPVITLVITLKKKIEKKDEEKKDEEKKDEEKKDEEKKDEPQYELIKRTISVGNKVKVARSIDDETGEIKEEEFYAIKVSGDLDDPSKAPYIYLVNDYKVGPLKKPLEDFVLKEEKKDSEDDGAGGDTPKDKPDGDEQPDKDEPDTDEPEKDEPEKDEPEKDEPEKDEPEKDEPEKDEPEKDEPEKDEPEKDEPEKDEPEKDEPEKDEPEKSDPGKSDDD
ncbi:MAG: hypothetical protein ACYTGZ_09145 [Planctomycetota bacterium]|jgi:hypothetical protein